MLSVDTSSIIAYLQDDGGEDTKILDNAFADRCVVIAPAVLSELLSDPGLSSEVKSLFKQIPLLAIMEGYWERVGLMRASLLAKKRKARLADALIAQSCIDHGVPLLSRDGDFRSIKELAGLLLVKF